MGVAAPLVETLGESDDGFGLERQAADTVGTSVFVEPVGKPKVGLSAAKLASSSPGTKHRHGKSRRNRIKQRDVTVSTLPSATSAGGNAQHNWSALEDALFPRPVTESPSRLLRVDERSPTEIFPTGFIAAGSNPDLLRHVEGAGMCPRHPISLQDRVSEAERYSAFV